MTRRLLEPISVEAGDRVAVSVGDADFALDLEVFSGPLAVLLHLIESRQLDVLEVPLAEVADAYVEHLARHPVDPADLAEFVAVASQLIYLKSKRLLPGEPMTAVPEGEEEPDEEALRQRLIEYRAVRDASRALGELDGSAPSMRREPRESDLPEAPAVPVPASLLSEALEQLATIAVPEPLLPEVVSREVTIGQQIAVLATALSRHGRVVLQSILAACRSRTERTVTFMAALELVRRREIVAHQAELFGPISLERDAGDSS